MTANIETQVTGYITPNASGTRLRTLPQTYSPVLTSYGVGDKVEIDKTILYTENDPAQPATMKNDLWGHVTRINGVSVTQSCFMAIDYHGSPICSKHYVVETPLPVQEIVWTEAILNGVDASGNPVQILWEPRK